MLKLQLVYFNNMTLNIYAFISEENIFTSIYRSNNLFQLENMKNDQLKAI